MNKDAMRIIYNEVMNYLNKICMTTKQFDATSQIWDDHFAVTVETHRNGAEHKVIVNADIKQLETDARGIWYEATWVCGPVPVDYNSSYYWDHVPRASTLTMAKIIWIYRRWHEECTRLRWYTDIGVDVKTNRYIGVHDAYQGEMHDEFGVGGLRVMSTGRATLSLVDNGGPWLDPLQVSPYSRTDVFNDIAEAGMLLMVALAKGGLNTHWLNNINYGYATLFTTNVVAANQPGRFQLSYKTDYTTKLFEQGDPHLFEINPIVLELCTLNNHHDWYIDLDGMIHRPQLTLDRNEMREMVEYVNKHGLDRDDLSTQLAFIYSTGRFNQWKIITAL